MALPLISAEVNDGGKRTGCIVAGTYAEGTGSGACGCGLNALAASRAVVIETRQNEGLPIFKVIILIKLNICIVVLVAGLN